MVSGIPAHAHFVTKKPGDKNFPQESFKLVHYAGDVFYNVNGFIDKNVDSFFKDLSQAMFESKNSLLREIFADGDKATWKGAGKMPTTAGTAFKASMNEMIGLLNSKQPSYIRCIKPNDRKAAGVFDDERVRHQVRYLGLMENVRVRRAGYCFRAEYEKFLWRYQVICPKTYPHWRGEAKAGVKEIITHLKLDEKEYQLGKTKLFLKNPKTVFQFEEVRENIIPKYVTKIQEWWRIIRVRRRIREYFDKLTAAFANIKRDPNYGKDIRWPALPHPVLKNAELTFKNVHRNWRAKKMILALPAEKQDLLRKKCLAATFFARDKPWNLSRDWAGNYLASQGLGARTAGLFRGRNDREVVFSDEVVKYSRGGRADKRMLIVSDGHIYKVDPSYGVTPKRVLPIKQIKDISVSKSKDTVAVIHSVQVSCYDY